MNLVKKVNIFIQTLTLICIVVGMSCSKKESDSKSGKGDKSPPANITNLALNGDSAETTLTWKNPTDIDFSKVLILRNTHLISDVPITGQDHTLNSLIDSSMVVHNSKSEVFIDSDLIVNTNYFYKVFSYDANFNYASGVEISYSGEADPDSRVQEGPPANIINPAISSNSGEATLIWENPTDIDFSKVLILRSTNVISDVPITAQDHALNSSIGSSIVVYNSNSEVFVDTDLMSNTDYFYKLFSYDTNFNYASGVEIPYSVEADSDHDGLIDIYTAEMLNNIRYDLAGSSYKTSNDDAGDSTGCPEVDPPTDPSTYRCKGYELMNNINLLSLLDGNDTDPDNPVAPNNQIDTIKEDIGDTGGTMVDVLDREKDKSWDPIGSFFSPFLGTFEGNNHTIDNLWLNPEPPAFGTINHNRPFGLFGVVSKTGKTVEIRNVGVISGSTYLEEIPLGVVSTTQIYLGSLIGASYGNVIIMNSYFSGDGGLYCTSLHSRSSCYTGGLVGNPKGGSLTIINSYFSGGGGLISKADNESTTDPTSAVTGGLVGEFEGLNLIIRDSYFSGGNISSYSKSRFTNIVGSSSGGLIGQFNSSTSGSKITITNSYFAGEGKISAAYALVTTGKIYAFVGALIGNVTTLARLAASGSVTITNGYWNTDADQEINGAAIADKVARGPDTNSGNTKGGNFINSMDNVPLSLTQLKSTTGTHPNLLPHESTEAWNLGSNTQLPAVKQCLMPTIVVPVTSSDPLMVTCSSYGGLIKGQRQTDN